MLQGSKSRYPKLAAVLKFVPKKNGLNPILAMLQAGDEDLGLDSMAPRDFERLNRDVRSPSCGSKRHVPAVCVCVLCGSALKRRLGICIAVCARVPV